MAIFTGQSGEQYEFAVLPWVGMVPLEAGLLILAKGNTKSPQPIVIARAGNLRTAFDAQRLAAIRRGASMLLVKIERNPERRLAIETDLLAAFEPPAETTAVSVR